MTVDVTMTPEVLYSGDPACLRNFPRKESTNNMKEFTDQMANPDDMILHTPRPQVPTTPPPCLDIIDNKSETRDALYHMVDPNKGFHIAQRLLDCWHCDDGKDLSVVCLNGHVLVHSSVLAAASPSFRQLHIEKDGTTALFIPDLSLYAVTAVMGLVYTGQLEVKGELLPDVKELLAMLKIPVRIEGEVEKIELVAMKSVDDGMDVDDLIDLKVDELLAEKIQMDKSEGSHFCSFCDKCFDTLKKMKLHVKQFHESSESSLFTCQHCSRCFNSASHLQTHQQSLCHQSSNKPTSITACDKNMFPVNVPLDSEGIGKSKEDINLEMTPPPKTKRKHERRNLPEQANVNYQEAITIFVCGVCQIKTNNFYPELKKHYETTHFIKEEKTYYCPSCNKKIVSTNSFHAHIHIVHREAKYACTKCVKKFKTAGSLEHHFTRWHTTERPYICEDCGEGMASALHLEAHMRMHKSNNVCVECGKKFLSASHLEKHRVVHTNDRPFMCGTCGKTFRDPYSVKECEMKHQGILKIKPSQMIPWRNREAKYVCDLCGYRTKGKAALDRHIRGRHTDERPFMCPDCGKDFKSKSSLDAHGGVHGKQLRQPGKKNQEGEDEGMIKHELQPVVNGAIHEEQISPKSPQDLLVGQHKVQGMLSQQDVLSHLAQQVPVSIAALRGDKIVSQLNRQHSQPSLTQSQPSLTYSQQILTQKTSSHSLALSTHNQPTSTQTQPISTHSQPISTHSQPTLCNPIQSLGVPTHLQPIPVNREKLVCLQAPHPQDVVLHRPPTAAYFWMQQQLPPQ